MEYKEILGTWAIFIFCSFECLNNSHMHTKILSHSTLKLGGTMTLPAGICSTMVSPSKSQRSHWESLASKAQGSSSTRSVFRPGFQQESFTCIGLSHCARGSSTDLLEENTSWINHSSRIPVWRSWFEENGHLSRRFASFYTKVF